MTERQESDLRNDEVGAVLATIFELPAEEIEDWLIIVKRPCTECDRPYCGNGALGTVGSRAGVSASGAVYHDAPFELHMVTKLAGMLASQWREERDSHADHSL